MNTISLLFKRLVPTIVMFGLALGPLTPAAGMVFESEPNKTCTTANEIGRAHV